MQYYLKTWSIMLLSLVVLTSSYAKGGYQVKKSFPVPGIAKWDYIALCNSNDNLYLSHGTKVNILNKNTGAYIGIIDSTEGVHGICFDEKTNQGYTSNGKANSLTVFNLKTNAVITTIAVGKNPDYIFYDKESEKVYVGNGKDNSLSIIDPSKNVVIKTVDVGGKPEAAVSGMNGKIYINVEDKNEVVVLNSKTFEIENHFKVGTGDEPAGLAIDVSTKRLFIGCGNKLMVVMDATNGKVIKEVPIGDGCDGVGFDEKNKIVYCSNGEGTLSAIEEKSADDYKFLENIETKKGARTLVVDSKTGIIYLPASEQEEKKPGEKRAKGKEGTFQVLVVGK